MDDWLILFDAAMEIIHEAERILGSKTDWTIGGGTMLRRVYAHRQSKDIDVFVTDEQLLGYFSPRLNDVALRYVEGRGSYVEQSNYLKFLLESGEIDFIVAPRLTRPHATMQLIGLHSAMVETPVEILAKKVFHRACDFTARDIFDLMLLVERGDQADARSQDVLAETRNHFTAHLRT